MKLISHLLIEIQIVAKVQQSVVECNGLQFSMDQVQKVQNTIDYY